jgi:hypothetical protein
MPGSHHTVIHSVHTHSGMPISVVVPSCLVSACTYRPLASKELAASRSTASEALPLCQAARPACAPWCARQSTSSASPSNGGAEGTRCLYVKQIGTHSRTEGLMLGLMNHFKRIYPSVGFFKPVGTAYVEGVPQNVQLMHSVFNLPGGMDAMTGTDERTAYQVRLPALHAPCSPAATPVCMRGLTLHTALAHVTASHMSCAHWRAWQAISPPASACAVARGAALRGARRVVLQPPGCLLRGQGHGCHQRLELRRRELQREPCGKP